jgi:acyl-CoA dehydrogenase
MNPERIRAAEAVGSRAVLRRAAVMRASAWSSPTHRAEPGDRSPLAQCWMEPAANLMAAKVATLYDRKMECAIDASAAKYLAAEAAFHACDTAVMTHGGMGYSKEFQVERYLREVMIPRIAPVTPHMILNFIAEKALGLPKSY